MAFRREGGDHHQNLAELTLDCTSAEHESHEETGFHCLSPCNVLLGHTKQTTVYVTLVNTLVLKFGRRTEFLGSATFLVFETRVGRARPLPNHLKQTPNSSVCLLRFHKTRDSPLLCLYPLTPPNGSQHLYHHLPALLLSRPFLSSSCLRTMALAFCSTFAMSFRKRCFSTLQPQFQYFLRKTQSPVSNSHCITIQSFLPFISTSPICSTKMNTS